MRERHLPRLCRSCNAPMSRQEAACWRCGTPWVAEDGPRTTLKVIAGGVQTEVSPEPERVAVRAASTTT